MSHGRQIQNKPFFFWARLWLQVRPRSGTLAHPSQWAQSTSILETNQQTLSITKTVNGTKRNKYKQIGTACINVHQRAWLRALSSYNLAIHLTAPPWWSATPAGQGQSYNLTAFRCLHSSQSVPQTMCLVIVLCPTPTTFICIYIYTCCFKLLLNRCHKVEGLTAVAQWLYSHQYLREHFSASSSTHSYRRAPSKQSNSPKFITWAIYV